MASIRGSTTRRHRTGRSATLLLISALCAPILRLVSFVPLPQQRGSSAEPVEADRGQVSRRQSLLAAVSGPVMVAAADGAAPPAWAEAPEAGKESSIIMPKNEIFPQGSKVSRMIICVQDDEALQKEVKFWTDVVSMKVLNKAEGVTTVGYSDDFGLELKVNKSIIGLPMPNLLNYDMMQPTVDSMYFMQFSTQNKVPALFKKVMANGGDCMLGTNTYIDAVSPRGVPMRLIRRMDEEQPRIEMIAFHIEAPAFDPVKKFYQRTLGLTEIRYPPEDPDVTRQSILLQSEVPGGPNVLLSPVADARLKERWLDYYDGIKVTVSNPDKTAASAKNIIRDILEEEQAGILDMKRRIKEAEAKGLDSSNSIPVKELVRAIDSKLKEGATRAKPLVMARNDGDRTVRMDDGTGNMIFLSPSA